MVLRPCVNHERGFLSNELDRRFFILAVDRWSTPSTFGANAVFIRHFHFAFKASGVWIIRLRASPCKFRACYRPAMREAGITVCLYSRTYSVLQHASIAETRPRSWLGCHTNLSSLRLGRGDRGGENGRLMHSEAQIGRLYLLCTHPQEVV